MVLAKISINAAAILAGGKASRLGYCAKGNLVVRPSEQKTIIEHEIDVLRSLGILDVIIIGNCSGDQRTVYAKCNCPHVLDARVNGGPLVGIESALHYFGRRGTNRAVVFLPCDLPNISAQVIRRLINGFIENQAKIVFARTQQSKVHPLCAVVDSNCLLQVSEALEKNEYSVQELWFALQGIPIDFEDETLFLNINSPGDFS